MQRDRLCAFSDGVFAIILTIMVLELAAPPGTDWHALRAVAPELLVYAFSFVYVGIYWANHHHFFHLVTKVNGGVLWANLDLLFWLSLIPFATQWLGHNPQASVPTEAYGIAILLPALAWTLMTRVCLRVEGRHSALARAMGRDAKGWASIALYVFGILGAMLHPWIGDVFYLAVALLWLVPDRRVERVLRGA